MGCTGSKTPRKESTTVRPARKIEFETHIDVDVPLTWSVIYDAYEHPSIASYLKCSEHQFKDGWCESNTREVIVKCSITEILEMFLVLKERRLEIRYLSGVG